MSTKRPDFQGAKAKPNIRIGIVAARFNETIVDKLLTGCLDRLGELGVKADCITIERVPGAFEIPLTAKAMCRTEKFAAVICLGAVVRGETPHFDYVAGECAKGIAQVSRDEMLPVIFGVLTTNTHEQALDRCGGKHGHAGKSAAEAAIEMIGVLSRIKSVKSA